MAPYDPPVSDRDRTAHSGGRTQSQSRNYSPLQALFLIRLNRLLHLRQEAVSRQLEGEWRLKLLSKSIYSTFCDCVELGVAEDARTLFERSRSAK
jgi:hypothetical protein